MHMFHGNSMRLLRAGVLACALLLFGLAPARADTLSLSADVPVVYQFSDSNLKSPSATGALVGLTLPFLVGVGAETYKVKGQVANLSTDFDYKVTMLDLYADLPFPGGNLVVGGGLGKGQFATVPASDDFPDAALKQAYFSVGVPFAGIFDAHVSYHLVRGEADIPNTVGKKVNLDASMATVGLKVGF